MLRGSPEHQEGSEPLQGLIADLILLDVTVPADRGMAPRKEQCPTAP